MYSFYPSLILRTPLLSIDYLLQDRSFDYVNSPLFKDALFLASPELYSLIYDQNKTIDEKMENTLRKYFNRMCSRCTPFGLFAGCSVVDWGDKTSISLDNAKLNRRTRPDKSLLKKILILLETDIHVFTHLSVKLNNTIYTIGEDYRFIEKGNDDNEYNISTFPGTEVVKFLMSITGDRWTSVKDITEAFTKKGLSSRDTISYLLDLYENQIISTSLDRGITANGLLDHWIDIIDSIYSKKKTISISKWRNGLRDLRAQFNSIDTTMHDNTQAFNVLNEHLKLLGIRQSANRIIQTDVLFDKQSSLIDEKIKIDLTNALNILIKIGSSPKTSTHLNLFRNRFVQKYDRQEVPLLVALDAESGLEYIPDDGSPGDLQFRQETISSKPSPKPDTVTSRSILQAKYEEALKTGSLTITLSDEDLKKMHKNEMELPATTSVMFRLIGDGQLQIEQVGGSSGINLFSRFTDFSPELTVIARDLADFEQRGWSHKILAELIHEPGPRAGNVISHIAFRKYDIPYYTQSARPEDEQLLLNDLMLSVRNNRFILRSKKINKEVIPMISNAYNYIKGSPIFRFIGDLQNESTDTLRFDFQFILPDKTFYPGLRYKHIVLAPAVWRFSYTEFQKEEWRPGPRALVQFLENKKVSRIFILNEGDNELLFDIAQIKSMELFFDVFRKKQNVVVKEFLFNPENYPIRDIIGQRVNNQFVAILLNSHSPSDDIAEHSAGTPSTAIRRKLSLGSEWIYYKIYCGVMTADKLISGEILALVKQLNQKKLISGCFFIRYRDPEPHLRLRFKAKRLAYLPEIIELTATTFARLEESGQTWKSQTETYSRELERYGRSILLSEELFFCDSFSCMQLISAIAAYPDEMTRTACALRFADDLMSCFGMNLTAKIAFSNHAKQWLKRDLGVSSEDDRKLNQAFRGNDLKYLSYLIGQPTKLDKIFLDRKKKLEKLVNKIQLLVKDQGEKELMKLLESYIHMAMNRLFTRDQKFNEYKVYDYLFKFYKRTEHVNKMR